MIKGITWDWKTNIKIICRHCGFPVYLDSGWSAIFNWNARYWPADLPLAYGHHSFWRVIPTEGNRCTQRNFKFLEASSGYRWARLLAKFICEQSDEARDTWELINSLWLAGIRWRVFRIIQWREQSSIKWFLSIHLNNPLRIIILMLIV